jgi:hypothetical protein
MRILTKMLRQKAVYWEPQIADQFNEKRWELPVEIKCRWEDGGEEQLDYDGETFTPMHTVYSDRDLKVGGLLLLAYLVDMEGTEPPEEAVRIRKVMKTPTLKANKFLRENFTS